MKTTEIIDGLEDLIQDRESFATPANDKFYGEDNPFRYDIEVLQAAINELNRRAEPENKACPVSRLQANEASITLLEIMEDGVADQQKALSIAYKALYWIANSRRAEPENKLTVTLPCKVGDTVYSILNGEVVESRVRTFWIGEIGGLPHLLMIRTTRYDVEDNQIGKTVFLTREAAEKALNTRKPEGSETP